MAVLVSLSLLADGVVSSQVPLLSFRQILLLVALYWLVPVEGLIVI